MMSTAIAWLPTAMRKIRDCRAFSLVSLHIQQFSCMCHSSESNLFVRIEISIVDERLIGLYCVNIPSHSVTAVSIEFSRFPFAVAVGVDKIRSRSDRVTSLRWHFCDIFWWICSDFFFFRCCSGGYVFVEGVSVRFVFLRCCKWLYGRAMTVTWVKVGDANTYSPIQSNIGHWTLAHGLVDVRHSAALNREYLWPMAGCAVPFD